MEKEGIALEIVPVDSTDRHLRLVVLLFDVDFPLSAILR